MEQLSCVKNIPKHWQIKKFDELLKYIQPTPFIVESTDYSDKYDTPVLTAGKSFILGRTNEKHNVFESIPVIIFDDFTTASKYVNFSFKVKSSAMKILQPKNESVNLKFVFYYMQTIQLTFDTHKRYWISVYSQLPIPLPPLPEQQLIVSKIEGLFSELDKGIESLKTAQQQLKVYRQSLLKAAFEGKLTARWRSEQHTYDYSLAAEPQKKYMVQGELPEGWKKVKLREVASINPKIPNKEDISKDTEVQFIPMKLVEETVNKIHLTEFKRFHEVLKGSYTPFVDGDLIFAKVTPCMENGKIAIVDNLKNGLGFGSSEFHVLRTNEKIINKFLFFYMVQNKFRKEAAIEMTGAVGLRRVPKQFLENYIIPLPSLIEQQLIVSELESKLTVCDKMEETINVSLQQAETLRQSILKRAFEGRLVNYEIENVNYIDG